MCVHLQLQSDQDHGNGLVKYVLSGEGAGTIFVIDENNGDLHATRRLDREEKAFYILKATVVNKRTGQKLEPETEFIIKLHDINDNEPHFSQEVYTGTVPERSDIGEDMSSWLIWMRNWHLRASLFSNNWVNVYLRNISDPSDCRGRR